jgi:hypothetical protein
MAMIATLQLILLPFPAQSACFRMRENPAL